LFSRLQPHQHQVISISFCAIAENCGDTGCTSLHCAWKTSLFCQSFLIGVTAEHPHRAIADYAKRWFIETLFGCLKTRGFCLGSTHLKDLERLSRMIALLTIPLCWAFRTGEWLAAQKPIAIKKHGRKARSIFRYGFAPLRRTLLNLEQHVDEFLRLLTFCFEPSKVLLFFGFAIVEIE
jgi:hypothetical protein